ncbi:MAG: hypothetical protein U5N85_16895 [Arcicella sp.]|nr:hypothetical protein [Arcicella sp.]
MNRLVDYILRLYPIDHVPLKRRVMLHGLFWGLFFVSLLIGSGFPSDTIILRLIGSTSFTVTSSVFFYVTAYLLPYLVLRNMMGSSKV